MALSLVCAKELERMEEVEKYLSSTHRKCIQAGISHFQRSL